jgi:hypothetical protein
VSKENTGCANCQNYNICKVSEHFLSGNTLANDLIKTITLDPDLYAQLHSGIDKILAENCRYYTDEILD